jgi:hypothetical protein
MVRFVPTTNVPLPEKELIDRAIAWLKDRLPPGWVVERSARQVPNPDPLAPSTRIDAAIDLRSSNGMSAAIAVEAKRSFAPRDAERLLSGLPGTVRGLAFHIPILVVAPWLSTRSQALLTRQGINFLDLTGNASINLDNPAIYFSSQGASRDPAPLPRGQTRVRGPKAARLIRLLVDVAPPFGVNEAAAACQIAPGYVSRLLDALDREGLVDRSRGGGVVRVDIAGLLQRWAETYDVFRTNTASRFVATNGPEEALSRLATDREVSQFVVTGSFAAVRVAPVAAPALLVAYCDDIAKAPGAPGLLPSDRGANLILLQPFDPVVFDRTRTESSVTYAALSQVAVDCLTGNGRMPSEGETLIDWMIHNEGEWRLPGLANVMPRSDQLHVS